MNPRCLIASATVGIGLLRGFGQTILPNDDVFVETSTDGLTTTTYHGHAQTSQIAFGLGAANGTSTGRRRSYLEFTLGTNTISSAKLWLYNYWGPNMGGGGNPTVSGTLRLLGSAASAIQFAEPAASVSTSFVPPADAGFTTIVSSLPVNPGATGNPVGWYSFDITSWYNARLGQTTTLLLRGSFTGYDFPLFEDRENTAYHNGSANTLPDSGPRIVLNETNSPPPPQELVAFPGAEGFGAHATGGRGGDVYYVMNLNDSGPGSLRNGVATAGGPRTIVFAVSGNIALQSILTINKPNLTVAGQTAPGEGICVKDCSLNIANTHDIIVRGLRLRRGDVIVRATGQPTSSVGLDTVSIDDSTNVIFDHCSLSWSCDEILGIVQNQNVTIQWCIISEPLGDPLLHPYGTSHAYGLNCSATTLSVHHNLIAKYVFRGPQFEANDSVSGQGYEVWMEAVNNVMFDYESSGSRYRSGVETGAGNVPFRFHFLNNFYLRNPTRTGAPEIEVHTAFGATNTVKVHVSGNLGPLRPNDSLDQWLCVRTEDDVPIRSAAADIQAQMSDVPLFAPPVPVTTTVASNAYKQVLSLAGCSGHRDAMDTRVVSNVVKRVFSNYLHSQSSVGGWPDLNTREVPLDTDRDGLPDYWEMANGLNAAAANNNHLNPDGYTDLEHYLNWLVGPHAIGAANGFVDLDLRSYAAGMASNANLVVRSAINGAVTLLGDGRTARFNPSPDLIGRAGFQFIATDSLAGGGITNAVDLLILPPPRFTDARDDGGQIVIRATGTSITGECYVLGSTNSALPSALWMRLATNRFDSLGELTFTNPANPSVAFYYRLELP